MDWMRVEGGGALPPGLDLGADGTISGTPTQDGNYGFIAMIVDATMTSVMQPLSIRVEPEPEVEETEDDGCTCATPGEERAPLAWLALLPGLALAVRRRRR
jgi:MYXO-CTERM domain-containing protein